MMDKHKRIPWLPSPVKQQLRHVKAAETAPRLAVTLQAYIAPQQRRPVRQDMSLKYFSSPT